MKLPSSLTQRSLVREVLIFLAFVAITIIMTWPWILHLRDAIPDKGDPYAISYFLWWDFHQTFRDPLHLFQATIFYPYRDSLAFGEYDYGVSLIFFPLFAIGLRPLTIYSVSAFLSFPFTGYAMFRLARTLSGSTTVAWIAGLGLAFIPFRFHHLGHLHLIFAGWIPLLFEAVVLFLRLRTWPRAVWLAVAFFMNGLTCTSWLILTVIPLGISALLFLSRYGAWNDRKVWLRSLTTLSLATLLLLPFLLPMRRAAIKNGFKRTPEEVMKYSATWNNWVAAEDRNRVWRGFGAAGVRNEMVLFPGLLLPLLALAAFLLPPTEYPTQMSEAIGSKYLAKELLLRALDIMIVVKVVEAVLAVGFESFQLRLFGMRLISVSSSDQSLIMAGVFLVGRCLVSYPRVLRNAMSGDRNLRESFSSSRRSELFGHAIVWIAIGVAGSFGLRFAFHRFLYEHVPLFQEMRVASRWAMVAYVGIVLLAGLGVQRITAAVRRWHVRSTPIVSGFIVLALLFELHAAPLHMLKGAADPDAITLDLRQRKMVGGVLELPFGAEVDHLYMLRAADHLHPVVNGIDSFVPPLQQQIEQLTNLKPIPDQLFDILESIPVSYVTARYEQLSAGETAMIEDFLNRGVTAGRLRFIKGFELDANRKAVLYAVTRTEPDAKP